MKRLVPILAVVTLSGCGTDVAGPSSSLLSCVYSEPQRSDVGEVLQVQGTGHGTVCLEGDGAAEYLYIPFFASSDTAREISVGLTGAGVGDITGTGGLGVDPMRPAISLFDGRPLTLDYAFHDRLRRREIEELGPKIRPGTPSPGTLDTGGAAADVPTVGDLRDFNVAISCSDVDARTGRVMYVSEHSVIYADTANPDELSAADFEYFAATFDTLVYRVETTYFGAPTDIDENGRAILFFTRAVNERNPAESNSVTIGFFWSGDLFPATATDRLEACPESNHSEMFYLIAPDPTGVAGVPFTIDDVRNLAIPLIGHEFQHLINASRRLFVNTASTFEAPWLNEGLSHAAEELLYFDVAGLRSGQNLNIDSVRNAASPADTNFNRYMGSNFNNFAKYVSRPDTASLMGAPNDLTTRGAVWNFLRYAADRSEADDTTFFHDMVNGTRAGLDNLNDVLGSQQALSWMHDWTVSVYADDFVAGIGPRFRVGSWNLRSLYENSTLETYPLRLTALQNGQAVNTSLLAGGATFHRFGVTADGRAVIHVEANGGTPPSTLRGSFLRIQ